MNNFSSEPQDVQCLHPLGYAVRAVLDDPSRKQVLLFVHGQLMHRDHSLLKNLADGVRRNTHLGTCRFDLATGLGTHAVQPRYGLLWKDLLDIQAVVSKLSQLGYSVVALCGHSKGGTAALLYAATRPGSLLTAPAATTAGAFAGRQVMINHSLQAVVSLSARYHLDESAGFFLAQPEISSLGYFDWHIKGARVRITKEELVEFAATDMTSLAQLRLPCLSLHGALDINVPLSELHAFGKAIGSPTTHTLGILEADHADHWFEGEAAIGLLLQSICPFLNKHIAAPAAASPPDVLLSPSPCDGKPFAACGGDAPAAKP